MKSATQQAMIVDNKLTNKIRAMDNALEDTIIQIDDLVMYLKAETDSFWGMGNLLSTPQIVFDMKRTEIGSMDNGYSWLINIKGNWFYASDFAPVVKINMI